MKSSREKEGKRVKEENWDWAAEKEGLGNVEDDRRGGSLEKIRQDLCQYHEAGGVWRRIVENQTHPFGVWHCKENVTGTSCIFTRLRKGHVGLHKQRYFKEPVHQVTALEFFLSSGDRTCPPGPRSSPP